MNSPLISVIIPTYNAEKDLAECLNNLQQQDYPNDKIEIFVVDGGSTDKTLDIAETYKCKILQNSRKKAPFAKAIGLMQAKGELIYLHEVDVRFSSQDWLKKMVKPLQENRGIFGVECDWGIGPDFNSFNTYCTLLKIADPLGRMLSKRNPKKVEFYDGYQIEEYAKGDNPIMYSFLWRRDIIDQVGGWEEEFAEGNFFSKIISFGHTRFGHTNEVTALHYYVNSLLDFTKKRKKIATQYLSRPKNNTGWVEKTSKLKIFLCVFYLASIAGPFIEALTNYAKTRRIEWFWHPVASFVTVTIYVYYFITNKI